MSGKEGIAEVTQQNVDAVAGIESALQAKRSPGERISDAIAAAIGSWPFILTQAALLFVWMILNVTAWIRHWDPFPFILLNLGLSFQAAFTGPIIMMSQNRQARFIERRRQLDLQIDLLAEQENTEMLRLLRLLCERTGIPKEKLAGTETLSEETQPATVIQQIARTDPQQS